MNLPPVDPDSTSASRIVAVALTVLALAGFAIFAITQLPEASRGGPDFPNYYFGGGRLLGGEPVYGSVAGEVQDLFGVDDYDAYPADPPASVLLLAPLSALPYATAWWLFAALSAILLVSGAYVVARAVGWHRAIALAVGMAFLVTSAGRFLLFRNHMEAILLALLILGWLALRRDRDISGGALWGLAAALKLFPALLIVGLLAARRTRAAVSAMATAVAVTGLGVLVVGWDNTIAFFRDVVPASQQWYGALGNYSLLSFGTALISEPFGWALAGLGGIGLVWWYWRGVRTIDQVWVAGTAAALLITPLSWLNYLVLVIPGLILLASRVDLRTVGGRWTLLGLTGALGFWGPIVLAERVPSVLLSFVPTYALVGLFFAAMRRLET